MSGEKSVRDMDAGELLYLCLHILHPWGYRNEGGQKSLAMLKAKTLPELKAYYVWLKTQGYRKNELPDTKDFEEDDEED